MPSGIKFAGPSISEWNIWRQTLTITTSKTFKMHKIHLSSTSAIMFGINKCKMIHKIPHDQLNHLRQTRLSKCYQIQEKKAWSSNCSLLIISISEHTPIETQTTHNNTLKLILHSSIQSQTARTKQRDDWLLIRWPLTRQKQNTLHFPGIPGDHLGDKRQLKLRMSAPRTHR